TQYIILYHFLFMLILKSIQYNILFLIYHFTVKCDKVIGISKVPVIFRNLILIDQVIPKCIPCKFIDNMMILMEIISVMSKYDIWVNIFFYYFKLIFHFAPVSRQIPILKIKNLHLDIFDVL